MSLVTPEQVKAKIPQILGNQEDLRIQSMIDDAEDLIAEWLGYPPGDDGRLHLDATAYTETRDGPREPKGCDPRMNAIALRRLRLKVRPYLTITEIRESASEDWAAAPLVEGDGYLAPQAEDIRTGIVWKAVGQEWLTGPRVVRVTYTAGLGVAGAAAPLYQRCVAWQVQYLLRTDVSGGVGLRTENGSTVDDESGSDGIDPRVVRFMGGHRLAHRLLGG